MCSWSKNSQVSINSNLSECMGWICWHNEVWHRFTCNTTLIEELLFVWGWQGCLNKDWREGVGWWECLCSVTCCVSWRCRVKLWSKYNPHEIAHPWSPDGTSLLRPCVSTRAEKHSCHTHVNPSNAAVGGALTLPSDWLTSVMSISWRVSWPIWNGGMLRTMTWSLLGPPLMMTCGS